MRLLVRFGLVLAILTAVGAVAYQPLSGYWKKRNLPEFRTAEVTRGDVVSIVNATGKVKPVESILIGSFVSGPILEMPVDFNMDVVAGQLMAQIDPRLYQAQKDAADAAVRIAEAEVLRAKAQWKQARNDEERAKALREKKKDFISDAEMDQIRFSCDALEAQIEIAEASVDRAKANLANSAANLAYTRIEAPKDGKVIDRKLEPGATLASSFQTPELFEVAVDLDERVYVHASVDETDVGLIRKAQERKEPVQFSVSAYPDDLFDGQIWQVRMSSAETQNVVTYPVVVEAANTESKLMPGMTATISFQIEEKKDVLRVPNAALRYFPKREHVREEDHKILEGAAWDDEDEENQPSEDMISASAKAEANRARYKRHVWVQEGEKLRAIEIETGLIDNKYGKFTELAAGELKEGQLLATGIKPKKGGFFGQ